MAEQIRIEVKGVDGRALSYVDVVTRRSGVVDRGEVRAAEIRFSSLNTRRRARGRVSKSRPLIGMLGPTDMARLGLDDRGEAP